MSGENQFGQNNFVANISTGIVRRTVLSGPPPAKARGTNDVRRSCQDIEGIAGRHSLGFGDNILISLDKIGFE